MSTVAWTVLAVLAVGAAAAAGYWLLVITEGVFLGRRVVVWLYDLTAEKYDGIKQFDSGAEQFFVVRPFLLRLAGPGAPRILDVATGTGRFPYFLLDEPLFHGRVIGLDPSPRMLAIASEKLAPFHSRAALVQQTASELPFADDIFDGVSCLEALEFFPDPAAALSEMVRVLRPGGAFMVTRRRGWEARAFVGRYYDVAGFERLLASFGLAGIETTPWQVEYDLIFAQKPAVQASK